MAIKSLGLGQVDVSLTSNTAVHGAPSQVVEAPGGLFPLQAKAFEMDEYRLMAGWPVSVPPYDIHVKTLVSANGEIITDRDRPEEIITDALIRWIADNDYYDITAKRWLPLYTKIGPVAWESTVANAPTLIDDYEYRVGDERFYRDALNFDSDSQNYLSASFEGYLSGSAGYTVIMVMSPNSAYGNNVSVPYNGLWTPQSKEHNYFSVDMQGRYLYLDTESSDRIRGISINPALGQNTPMYLAMVFTRPETFFYVGEGPSSIRVKNVPAGEANKPLDADIFLGRSTEDLTHTADMALFDLSIYADQLAPAQIANEFALLSRAYGGDS